MAIGSCFPPASNQLDYSICTHLKKFIFVPNMITVLSYINRLSQSFFRKAWRLRGTSASQPNSLSESGILCYSVEFAHEITDTYELKPLAHVFMVTFLRPHSYSGIPILFNTALYFLYLFLYMIWFTFYRFPDLSCSLWKASIRISLSCLGIAQVTH